MVIKCIEEDVNKVALTVRPASYPTTCHYPFHALYSDGASVVCGGDGAQCVLVMSAYDACGQHVVNHRAAVRVASVRRVRGLRVSFGSLSHLLLPGPRKLGCFACSGSRSPRRAAGWQVAGLRPPAPSLPPNPTTHQSTRTHVLLVNTRLLACTHAHTNVCTCTRTFRFLPMYTCTHAQTRVPTPPRVQTGQSGLGGRGGRGQENATVGCI